MSDPRKRSPEHEAKKAAYFAAVRANRKLPYHCARCGKPNPAVEHGSCPTCLAYKRAWKARQKQPEVRLDEHVLAELAQRIESLERRQETMQKHWRRRWDAGYRAGRLRERLNSEESRTAWETIFGKRGDILGCQLGHEEFRQMSHVGTRERAAS